MALRIQRPLKRKATRCDDGGENSWFCSGWPEMNSGYLEMSQ
jgi:hypothetical protein